METTKKVKQSILDLIQAEKCNIETSDFDNENDNAEMFAYDYLNLITIDDIYIDNDNVIRVNASKIEELFTKDWKNYQGAGNIFIEAREKDKKTLDK